MLRLSRLGGHAMRRRAFITLLGGAVVWPAVTRAQHSEAVRRIGVLMNRTADDPQGQARLAAFQQRLQQLGWTDGGNVRIDTRWGADDVESERRYASELVALAPDIVLASGTLSVTALQRVGQNAFLCMSFLLRVKADMCSAHTNVRFGPIADMDPRYSITSSARAKTSSLNQIKHELGRPNLE